MKDTDVLLGYEVGTGKPVRLPLRHMVVTGQTQEAGKTTTLEALISRSAARAVCFVTKRGEGSFTGARRIDPYFREQADWQFVSSILEASRGEKLKMERSWIIRASKGATTLAKVQENVREELKKAKGFAEGMYLCLDAYLEVVVPQIAEVEWATSVQLGAGINAMDMTLLAGEMQHLVIRSTIDWTLKHEEGTVVVVPEAWKFIPQGRGTPVKLAAEAYIRQGAGLKNFLWLDSQDIAGVDKTILKSVPVWILGVQREANEIKRTLDQIPAGIKKPKADDIATLGLGEFFACWGNTIARTYVQPAWMSDEDARAIAMGKMTIRDVQPKQPPKVSRTIAKGEPNVGIEDSDIQRIINGVALKLQGAPTPVAAPATKPAIAAPENLTASQDEEAIFQRFKARLMREAPGLIHLLVAEPEIHLKIERKTIELDQTSAKGMMATLMLEGFFDEATKATKAWAEAKRRWNYKAASPRIYEALDAMTVDGFVTKEADGYKIVPEAKKRIKKTG